MNRMAGFRLNRKAFSLAEVLIVVAIVAILAGISVPLFSTYLEKQQLKHIEEQELAAKIAAVSAFYAGYDSAGNKVDISQNGICTFLYDAEDGSVYVSNSSPNVSDFEGEYSNKIDGYGIKDHSNQVILVWFDGRYYKKPNEKPTDFYTAYGNMSKGTFEEPCLYLDWYDADALITTGNTNGN